MTKNTMPQAEPDSPTVSFASDLDGDLHMFSSDPDVDLWTVVIGTVDGADDAPASGQFWGYYTLAPEERCWYVESSGAHYIEIRRPGRLAARLVHPRRSVYDHEYREASGERLRELIAAEKRGFQAVKQVPMRDRHAQSPQGLFIGELLFEPETQVYSAEKTHACPSGVDISTVRSYLEQRYGDALDVAWTNGPDGHRVDIGWTFRAPQGSPGNKRSELVATLWSWVRTATSSRSSWRSPNGAECSSEWSSPNTWAMRL